MNLFFVQTSVGCSGPITDYSYVSENLHTLMSALVIHVRVATVQVSIEDFYESGKSAHRLCYEGKPISGTKPNRVMALGTVDAVHKKVDMELTKASVDTFQKVAQKQIDLHNASRDATDPKVKKALQKACDETMHKWEDYVIQGCESFMHLGLHSVSRMNISYI